MLNSVQKILAHPDRAPRVLPVPVWEESVYVCAMSALDLPKYLAGTMSIAEVAAIGICDSQGRPLTWTAAEVARLAEKHAAAVDLIALEVLKLTGFEPDDRAEQGPVKMNDDQMKAAELGFQLVAEQMKNDNHASRQAVRR